MKLLVVICTLLAVSHALGYSEQLKQEWHSFKLQHGKVYSNPKEEQFRMKVFLENKNMIDKHNEAYVKGTVTYQLGLNKFADMTDEEFIQSRGKLTLSTKPQKMTTKEYRSVDLADIPSSFDWRQYGAVTPVMDQGNCQASWAIAVTGAIETQYFKKNGQLIPLSVQNIVDCNFQKNGCKIHDLEDGFYVAFFYGLNSAASYPYEQRAAKCRMSYKPEDMVAKVDHETEIQRGNSTQMREAVALEGPVAVLIDTDAKTFRFYKSGVYYDETCSYMDFELDQAALVVGYGTENGEGYWIMRNSWGEAWGEAGYMRIASRNNICGVTIAGMYPTLVN